MIHTSAIYILQHLHQKLNCVSQGYWDSLDELRGVYRSGKQWDPQSEVSERELLVCLVEVLLSHLSLLTQILRAYDSSWNTAPFRFLSIFFSL